MSRRPRTEEPLTQDEPKTKPDVKQTKSKESGEDKLEDMPV